MHTAYISCFCQSGRSTTIGCKATCLRNRGLNLAVIRFIRRFRVLYWSIVFILTSYQLSQHLCVAISTATWVFCNTQGLPLLIPPSPWLVLTPVNKRSYWLFAILSTIVELPPPTLYLFFSHPLHGCSPIAQATTSPCPGCYFLLSPNLACSLYFQGFATDYVLMLLTLFGHPRLFSLHPIPGWKAPTLAGHRAPPIGVFFTS